MRYDSPSLGPITLSVSAGQADRYEGAARWSQGLGGGQISAALFYGQQPKVTTWYLKVGHKWGNNAVSVSYGESEDVIAGFKDKGFQIGFNHNIPKAKVDLYAGVHGNQLDTPGAVDVDDIYTVVVGTKLKFD